MKNIPKRPTLILAKIKSFIKFKDVAKCIQLVALASLKKMKDKLATRHTTLAVMKDLFYIENNINTHPNDYENKILSIVTITTEKSCSGAINTRTSRYVLRFYQKIRNIVRLSHFIFIGKKGSLLIRKRFKNNVSIKLFKELEKDVNSLVLSYLVVNSIHKKNFDTCIIFFNKFESGFSSKIAYYQIDSFDQFVLNVYSSDRPFNRLFDLLIEKNIGDDFFFLELYYFYFCLILLDALEENNYSELASRAQAMESAVKNTTERIASLTLVYNKTRQALITNEIIEVLNASSAIL